MSNVPNGELKAQPYTWVMYSNTLSDEVIIQSACRKLGCLREQLEIKKEYEWVYARIKP